MTRFCFLLTIRNLNYFWNAKIFYSHYVFKGAKLAKFIRFEAAGKLMWDTRCELKGASISITKFTELGWNDGVFVHIEEHQRCSGKRTGFFLFLWILIIFIRKDFLYFLYVLRKQSWRNSFALKRGGKWYGMRYEMRGARCEYFYHKVHGDGENCLCFWGL